MIQFGDDKISKFILDIIDDENIEPQNISVNNILPRYSFFAPLNTQNLSGFKLKLVELYNTLFKIIIGPIYGRKRIEREFAQYSKLYLEFISTNQINFDATLNEISGRILLDVTYTMGVSTITGIPRVVSQLAKNGMAQHVVPVFLYDKVFYCLNTHSGELEHVQLNVGDRVFYADASWNYPNCLIGSLDKIKEANSKSIFLIYDLIPLIYPALSNENHVNAFTHWLEIALMHSDNFICISKSVADELELIIRTKYSNLHSIKNITFAYLGSDFDAAIIQSSNHLELDVIAARVPYFLSVGTVEPRKAYCVAIDAIEEIWNAGVDAKYVIVGKYGWSQASLRERILNHPEFGKRLYWLDSATDQELHCLYGSALALVSTSLCEGFGLPLIEAAHNNLAAIVSDIPVFREIGGASTQYFELTNSRQLANLLRETVKKSKTKPDVLMLTWQEASAKMFNIINNDDYPKIVVNC